MLLGKYLSSCSMFCGSLFKHICNVNFPFLWGILALKTVGLNLTNQLPISAVSKLQTWQRTTTEPGELQACFAAEVVESDTKMPFWMSKVLTCVISYVLWNKISIFTKLNSKFFLNKYDSFKWIVNGLNGKMRQYAVNHAVSEQKLEPNPSEEPKLLRKTPMVAVLELQIGQFNAQRQSPVPVY